MMEVLKKYIVLWSKQTRRKIMKAKNFAELGKKQIAVIMFGGGLNYRQLIADYRAKGYGVSVKSDHALVYQI